MGKNKVEAYQILENIALNDCQWPVERATPKKPVGVFNLDMFTNLSAQLSTLSKQLQASQQLGSQVYVHKVEEIPPACEQCHGPHPTSQCLMMNALGDLTIKQTQYEVSSKPKLQSIWSKLQSRVEEPSQLFIEKSECG